MYNENCIGKTDIMRVGIRDKTMPAYNNFNMQGGLKCRPWAHLVKVPYFQR